MMMMVRRRRRSSRCTFLTRLVVGWIMVMFRDEL